MRACPRCGETYDDDSSFCPRDGAELEAGAGATLASGSDSTVLGSYRLLRMLGQGGMGRVFLAEHVKLGRRVALKMLRPELAANAEAVRRFFAEARAVNQVAHQNIVSITDFFEADGAGQAPYLIMEYLEGESLRALLDREPVPDLPRTISIALQLADALAAVHAAGIVHRDLKPDNVFLTDSVGRESVKILDFGIAKLRSTGDGRSMLHTAHGAVLGTPEYMSPEQAEATLRVDHRADVYALGVILYEMVSGRKPIVGNTISETLIKQLTWTPPLPSEATLDSSIPTELEALIMRCLEKAADRRPRDMREVEASLRNVHQRLTGATAPYRELPVEASLRNVHQQHTGATASSRELPVQASLRNVDQQHTGVTTPSRELPRAAQPSQAATVGARVVRIGQDDGAVAAVTSAPSIRGDATVISERPAPTPAGGDAEEAVAGPATAVAGGLPAPTPAGGDAEAAAAGPATAVAGGLPLDIQPAKTSGAGYFILAVLALAVLAGGAWYLLSATGDAPSLVEAEPARQALDPSAIAKEPDVGQAVDAIPPAKPTPDADDADTDASDPAPLPPAEVADDSPSVEEPAPEAMAAEAVLPSGGVDAAHPTPAAPKAPSPAAAHSAATQAPPPAAVNPAAAPAPAPARPQAPSPASSRPAAAPAARSTAPAPAGSAVHAPRPASSPARGTASRPAGR